MDAGEEPGRPCSALLTWERQGRKTGQAPRAPPAFSAALVAPAAVVAIWAARAADAPLASAAACDSLAAPMPGIMLGRLVVTKRAASAGSVKYWLAASTICEITPSSPALVMALSALAILPCSAFDCLSRQNWALSLKNPATSPSGDTRFGMAPRMVFTPSASCTPVSAAASPHVRSGAPVGACMNCWRSAAACWPACGAM